MLTGRSIVPMLVAAAGLAHSAAAQCPPDDPHSLTATQGSHCGDVFLQWPDVSGANDYKVYRSTSTTFSSASVLGTAQFGVSQFTDLTALIGVDYYYWVTAERTLCLPGHGASNESNRAHGYRGQAPDAPTLVTASNDTTCNGIRVAWSQSTPTGAAVDSYTVYRNTINLYLTSVAVGTISNPDLRGWIDYSAAPDTVYYYWVRAENQCGTAPSTVGARGHTYADTPPQNDSCASAYLLTNGFYFGYTQCATSDGAGCALASNAPDVWYRYAAPAAGTLHVDTCDPTTNFDTVLSIHSGCPGTAANMVACADSGCSSLAASVDTPVIAGHVYYIRVSGGAGQSGQFVLHLSGPAGVCYANCDASTAAPVLNVNDFICFQTAFAAGQPYANCDGSTTTPVLNVNDFICFQSRFAAGCP